MDSLPLMRRKKIRKTILTAPAENEISDYDPGQLTDLDATHISNFGNCASAQNILAASLAF